jgi:hypothetical protein
MSPIMDLSELHRLLHHWNEFGELPMSSLIPHKVTENPYSVTARRASYKSPSDEKRMVQAESLLEYDFFSVLDFDFRVSKYKEQAIVIPWRTPSGQYRRYTADALVSFRTGFNEWQHLKSAVFEVKPTEIIRQEWDKLLPKYRGIRRSLQGTFVPFKVITERHLHPEFVKNCKFLNEYSDKALRLDKAHPFQYEMRSVICEKARELQVMTPRILLDSISKDFHLQSELVPWMWNQFNHFILGMQMDMMQPLNMNTEIWHHSVRHRTPDWLRRENDWYR